ncbi:MAG TPA: hypothetical protein VJZ91_19245 [Blastocatellia bacterium]|nr:hypothetical protein [Blastocatellia bacterium]
MRWPAVALLVLLGLSFGAGRAHAQSWSLSTAQRQAYLNYYAPLILKRGDENNSKEGRDWLTNFDFDRDGDFSNNRLNWRNINYYVAAAQSQTGAYSNWRIRPTLYTALIEYMDGGSKSVVLLYHVYNAADKDGDQIHDWERVEILVRGVGGTPGAGGEFVNHVTVTHHKDHVIRRYYDTGLLNFMQTATGNHVMLWQADESNFDLPSVGPHGHELRFVKDTYSYIAGQRGVLGAEAKVRISDDGDNRRNVHYVFVPEGSSAAVGTWAAKELSYSTASGLASRVDNGNTVTWTQTKRITYELQDLADIFPTNWQFNPWYIDWLSSDFEDVLLESPIINEAGLPEVSAGLQRFYTKSRDIGKSDLTDGREGVLSKNWLYGSYSAEFNADTPSGSDNFQGFEGYGLDSYGWSRGAASGYFNSHGSFWWQHDFFVHSGVLNTAETREEGMWLRGAWYTAANGGFDGRWVQLFDDRPAYEAPPPPPVVCSTTAQQQCDIKGGTWNPNTCTCKALCSGCQIP